MTTRYSPLRNLLVSRLREFFREPEALFWVYGFPVLLAVGLGIAFRDRPPEQIRVDVVLGQAMETGPEAIIDILEMNPGFRVEILDEWRASARLRMGQSDITVISGESHEYVYDASRPQSLLARALVDDALQRGAGRSDVLETSDRRVSEPGSRYIDFLIPGLLGMNLMGGGLWGIGFVTVDMRVRRLLKRFVATPMNKSDFLLALIGSRLIFMVPEVLLLLLVGVLFFRVMVAGSLVAVAAILVLGAVSFAGLGLLVACRAQKIETVSGLMNMVMLPMWLFSGIFFSSDRFPDAAQPFIGLLPLTMLNDALRAVILEGEPLAAQGLDLAGLTAWGAISFALGLKLFRWH